MSVSLTCYVFNGYIMTFVVLYSKLLQFITLNKNEKNLCWEGGFTFFLELHFPFEMKIAYFNKSLYSLARSIIKYPSILYLYRINLFRDITRQDNKCTRKTNLILYFLNVYLNPFLEDEKHRSKTLEKLVTESTEVRLVKVSSAATLKLRYGCRFVPH